jgi:hypothetical protein
MLGTTRRPRNATRMTEILEAEAQTSDVETSKKRRMPHATYFFFQDLQC